MVMYEFSENIQRGILFLVKSDETFLSQAMPMIKAEYFEYPSHQKIYNVVKDYYLKYKKLPADDHILEEVKSLKTANELFSDYRDEINIINTLDEKSIANEEYLLDSVEEFAKQQALKEAILESVDLIQKREYNNIHDLIRSAMSVSRNIDLGTDYFTSVDERWDRLNQEDLSPKFLTVFNTLNTALEGGMASKELAMVVAPPGVGKSLYLANQAARSCLDGHNVLYITLEMSEDRVAQRLDSIFTRIRQIELKDKRDVLKERLDTISSHVGKLGSLKIKEFPTKRADVNTIRAYIAQLKNYENFTPDVIVVDYLELMSTDAKFAEYQAQERLAQELRGLASETNSLLWTATQTNREGKKVNLITDTELADSYGKTRVCDLVISINQTEEEFDGGKARVYVIKSRNGKARFVFPTNMDYNRLVIKEN
jgi:replicative DNA helicase